MPRHEVEYKQIHYGVTFSQDWDQGGWGVGRDGGERLCLGEASSGLDMSRVLTDILVEKASK